MEFNAEMSRKYGVKVYNIDNPAFPYYVEGMFEEQDGLQGCTESELKDFVEYHHGTEPLSPWACEIIGWYESVKNDPERHDELEDIVDEIIFYLETMFGTDGKYPEWLQNFLWDVDGNFGVSYDVWIPIIDRVIPHLG